MDATLAVRTPSDPTPTNLPYDASGKRGNPNGSLTVANQRPPRPVRLVARFQL